MFGLNNATFFMLNSCEICSIKTGLPIVPIIANNISFASTFDLLDISKWASLLIYLTLVKSSFPFF